MGVIVAEIFSFKVLLFGSGFTREFLNEDGKMSVKRD